MVGEWHFRMRHPLRFAQDGGVGAVVDSWSPSPFPSYYIIIQVLVIYVGDGKFIASAEF